MRQTTTQLMLILLFSTACILVPALQAQGRWGELTISEEIDIGRKFNAYVRSSMPLVEDTEISGYVENVVYRLLKNIPPQPFRFSSTLINNGSMNAFAIPGGYVYVFTGLLLNLQNEDQMAAVLAHELAHVTKRHVAKRITEMHLANIGSIAGTLAGVFLGIAGGGSNMTNIGSALMIGSQSGAATAYLHYTQDNEREADHQGLNYLVAAGYTPIAMAEIFNIMQKQRWHISNDKIPAYLSTHPSLSDRIAYINSYVANMPQDYLKHAGDNTPFLRAQNLARAKLQATDVALAWYNNKAALDPLETMGLGIVQTRLHRINDAERSFKKAIAALPGDFLILREAGIFYFKQGNFQKAQPFLQKALILKPNDVLTIFYNARLLGESQQYSAAIVYMHQVLKQLPEDPEVRYHMGRLLGESGDEFGGHLNLAYYYELQHNKKQATFHLEKARYFAHDADNKKQLEEFDNFRRKQEELIL